MPKVHKRYYNYYHIYQRDSRTGLLGFYKFNGYFRITEEKKTRLRAENSDNS